jgi:signal transduction histidine kinase
VFIFLHSFLLATSLFLLILAFYVLKFKKKSNLASPLFFLLTCIFFHSLGYAFELTSDNISDIYFWLKVEYIGIAFSPTFYLIFTIQYAEGSNYLRWRYILIFLLFSTVTFLFQITNWNHIFYTSFNIYRVGDLNVALFQKGAWYWIHQGYINLVLLFCSSIYLKHIFLNVGRNKRHAFLIFIASIVPWLFYLAYLFNITPHHIDLSPFAFSFVGIVCTLAILRFQLLYDEPIALESVFNSIDEGIIIIDKQKKLLQFNNQMLSIFPEIKQIDGKIIDSLINPLFNIDDAIVNCKTEIPEISIDINNVEKFYHVKIFPITKSGNHIKGWLFVFVNISKVKEAEITLKNLLKQQEIYNSNQTRFLAILGHDLRNPLHLITTISDILVTEIQSGDYVNAEDSARMLYDTAYTTSYLTENLLKWAQHIRNGLQFNKVLASLFELVQEETDLLSSQFRRKNITCNIDIEAEIIVSVDKDMIKTIIRNLLNNAVKYSYPDGDINVSSKIIHNEIITEVRDFGIGIQLQEIEKMFRFDAIQSRKGTASEIGTGIGLVLCREFVELHNGRIWVESIHGNGSKFYFALPYN